MRLAWLAAAVLAVNVPFGFWRAGTRKFGLAWFVAVHGPVPVVAAMRVYSGIGWHLATFPLLVAAYFTGQFFGGSLRRLWSRSASPGR